MALGPWGLWSGPPPEPGPQPPALAVMSQGPVLPSLGKGYVSLPPTETPTVIIVAPEQKQQGLSQTSMPPPETVLQAAVLLTLLTRLVSASALLPPRYCPLELAAVAPSASPCPATEHSLEAAEMGSSSPPLTGEAPTAREAVPSQSPPAGRETERGWELRSCFEFAMT